MMPRFRACIRSADPLVLNELDGGTTIVPAGWRYVVFDTDRLPSKQVVFVGTRATQPEALEAACERIKILQAVGR